MFKNMKFKMLLVVCISLIAIMSICAVSASEDIADDTVTAMDSTDEAISQTVDEIEHDDETCGADGGEEILTDGEDFEPKGIEPHEFFENDLNVAFSNMFSVGEKFPIGINTTAKVNGTFKVYYAGYNDFGFYKLNDTVLAESEIIDGIGIAEVSVPKTRILGYLTDYTDFWIEYKTPKGNGGIGVDGPQIIENNKNISATVKPLEFVENGNNNISVKVYMPVDGALVIYLDGKGTALLNNNSRSLEKTYEGLTVGNHTVRVFFEQYSYYGESIYGPDPYKYSESFKVTVKEYVPVIVQAATEITSSAVSLTYNTCDANVTFTLKDEDGNALSDRPVNITFNGNTYEKVTDSKGQASISVSSDIVPDTYYAAMRFAGDESYNESSGSAKIVIIKATPKITAAKKTSFKAKSKNKKVKMTLKANGKAISGVKVAIKVNKKTYTAKTKSSGKATFKITKLTKKGSYKATISYRGNAYYNAKSAKVKIILK